MTDWDDILARYGPRIWRMARRLLGNAHDADECLQEVFLAAWAYSRSKPIRHWPAFLQVTMTNKALDRLRRDMRAADGRVEMPTEATISSRDPSPEQQAHASELAERLRRALIQLSADEAQVFTLCCLEDFDHREVAETLGISVAAVGTRLHRARNRLRGLLASTESVGCGEEV